jgi:CBS domain containing-hemolysin-like protein
LPRDFGRIIAVGLWTFALSAALSYLSGSAAGNLSPWFSVAVLMAIIATGILFDIVGTAAAAASEAPINAMAANRVYGASEALRLVRNSPAVASICNDVVGDICGTVSGAVGATIILRIAASTGGWLAESASVLVIALISAVTVAGKAIGKRVAIESANDVVLSVGRIIATYERFTGRSKDAKGRKRNNGRSSKD